MREAKYARLRASGPTRREEAAAAEGAAVEPGPCAPGQDPRSLPNRRPAASEDGLCGHKSMNGRACTRPAGHAEKSHRYG